MQQNLKNSNFPTKLQQILSKSKYRDIIRWDQTKSVVELVDQYKLQTIILPKYFRHNRIQSFFRQLNLYGFQKTKLNGIDFFSNTLLKQGKSIKQLKSRNQLMREKYNEDLIVRSNESREAIPSETEVRRTDKNQQNQPTDLNTVSHTQVAGQAQIYPFQNYNNGNVMFYNPYNFPMVFNGFLYFNNTN